MAPVVSWKSRPRLMSSARRSDAFGAVERAEPDADLPERCQRHGQPVARRELLVAADALLGERQRLVVAMPHHRHVRLVPVHDGQHVVGVHGGGEALGLAQRGERLVEAAGLRERAAGERVHQGEAAAIADRVQRRGGLGEVLAHRRGLADLLVAACELEAGEADGARVVRELCLPQRALVQRDGARLLAAHLRHAAVQPPEVREGCGGHGLAERVGRPAEHGARLVDVVLQEPGFGERDAEANSSSRVSAVDRSAGARCSTASAPRPRSRAAWARAMSGCRATVTTAAVYTGPPIDRPMDRPRWLNA
jgi:hypothetical protein